MTMAEEDPSARRNPEPREQILNAGMFVWLSQLEHEASASRESSVRFLSVYATTITGALFIAWREEDHTASLARPLSSFFSELSDPTETPIEAQEYQTLIALTSRSVPDLWLEANPKSRLAQSLIEEGEDAPLATHALFLIEMFESARPDLQDEIDRYEAQEATNDAISEMERIMGRFFPDITKKPPIAPPPTFLSIATANLDNYSILVLDQAASFSAIESLAREDLQKAVDDGKLTLEEAVNLFQDFVKKTTSKP